MNAAQSSELIDLRSDTVTKPTREMRQAMFEAEVGDAVYGEDPTVLKLQDEVAALLGKEAALYVPSGTMANLISCLVHCDRRDSELLLGDECHINVYEQGGVSTLGGIHTRTLHNQPDGTILLADIAAGIRPLADVHQPVTRLVCLENTHNRCGGRVLTAEYTDAVGELAHSRGLKLHVDGSRLMNAAVALGVPAARLVKAADSVTLCLSKGLSAPVGSLVVGSKEFILSAKRYAKCLGGGMRQCGVIAAAGLVAVRSMVERLRDDHDLAKALAAGLASMRGLRVDSAAVDTNIVRVDLDSARLRAGTTAAALQTELRKHGVLVMAFAPLTLRAVVHVGISRAMIERALAAFQSVLAALVAPAPAAEPTA